MRDTNWGIVHVHNRIFVPLYMYAYQSTHLAQVVAWPSDLSIRGSHMLGCLADHSHACWIVRLLRLQFFKDLHYNSACCFGAATSAADAPILVGYIYIYICI